ncbi:hypothetical protein AVJ23_01580 [Pseudoponticoccus marisrubri]|uniref:Uncharacterized protein n=1 Tax=Pseudoponticoccus marisrubri TaxID=1685382 RepID=A0A0W7WPE5_9RHOB|nr:hypothetical protein AVJ23_01580 [Pseudoponticoccus marisrubri]
MLALAALTAWALQDRVELAEAAPPAAPAASQSALEDALVALQDASDDAVGTLEVTGRSCLELQPDRAALLAGQVRLRDRTALAVLLSTKSLEEAAPLAEDLQTRLPDGAVEVRVAIANRLARLALGAGDTGRAATALQAVEGLAPDPCLGADTAFLAGRLAEQRGQGAAAQALYAQAVELNPLHLPAHVEILRRGLAAPTHGPEVEAAVHAMQALGRFRGARRYAIDLSREAAEGRCRTEGCHYLGAVMLNWANLPQGALRALDALERHCRAQPCQPGIVAAAQGFRARLNGGAT